MLSERQLRDWGDYYAVDPFGEERADMRMTRTVWAVFQSQAGKKRIDENDFRFQFEPKAPPTPEEYRAKAMRAYLGQGGRIERPQ